MLGFAHSYTCARNPSAENTCCIFSNLFALTLRFALCAFTYSIVSRTWISFEMTKLHLYRAISGLQPDVFSNYYYFPAGRRSASAPFTNPRNQFIFSYLQYSWNTLKISKIILSKIYRYWMRFFSRFMTTPIFEESQCKCGLCTGQLKKNDHSRITWFAHLTNINRP